MILDRAFAALLLTIPLAGNASGQESVAPTPDFVLRIDQELVERDPFEAWLLRERGELLAPFYARYLVAEQAAASMGIRLADHIVLEAVDSRGLGGLEALVDSQGAQGLLAARSEEQGEQGEGQGTGHRWTPANT